MAGNHEGRIGNEPKTRLEDGEKVAVFISGVLSRASVKAIEDGEDPRSASLQRRQEFASGQRRSPGDSR